jgi:hypothetical protein
MFLFFQPVFCTFPACFLCFFCLGSLFSVFLFSASFLFFCLGQAGDRPGPCWGAGLGQARPMLRGRLRGHAGGRLGCGQALVHSAFSRIWIDLKGFFRFMQFCGLVVFVFFLLFCSAHCYWYGQHSKVGYLPCQNTSARTGCKMRHRAPTLLIQQRVQARAPLESIKEA